MTRLFLLAAFALAAASGPLAAQAVRGTITDPQTGAAIDGAIIVLLDEQGQPVGQVLSNNSGRFLLRTPGLGTYALRADRIGHASTYSERFTFTTTQTLVVDLEAEVEAIQLTGIDVDAERRCVRQRSAIGATALLWEEARKALTAATQTSSDGVYRYELLHRSRQLGPDARRVERESTRLDVALRRNSFVSKSADSLARYGYAVDAGNRDMLYYGPDASVLLSDSFLDTHCFSVRAGRRESEGLIGLSFEPVPGRSQTEIDGTLWLDPVTAELRWVDFRYLNLVGGVYDVIGGRVEFQALPSGNWFISRWAIRMPLFERRGTNMQDVGLVGVSEVGAQVVGVRDSRGRPVLDFETGTVIGAVRDAFGQQGLGAARVFLVGTDHSVFTDDDGRFRITGLDEGEYRISYEHPTLDSIGHVPTPRPVDVEVGRATTVSLEAPSRYTTLMDRCAESDLPNGTAILLGHVRDILTGEPLGAAQVTVLWTRARMDAVSSIPSGRGAEEARQGGGGLQGTMVIVDERTQGFQVQADSEGFYLFCGVPDNHPLRVQGSWNDSESREIQIRIPSGALYRSYDVEMRTSPGP